jgi:ribulose-bisphosphate carboxylase large chain
MPVPAGGMSRERVPEMLDFYGSEVMLLIGGALLEARERLTQETAAFVADVKGYRYG